MFYSFDIKELCCKTFYSSKFSKCVCHERSLLSQAPVELANIRLGWNLLADTNPDDNIIVIFVQLGFSMKLTHLSPVQY